MRYKSTFKKLIAEVEEYEWMLDVYVEFASEIKPETSVLILHDESEDDRDENDEPVYPTSRGYSYLMSIHQVSSVIENLVDGGRTSDFGSIIEAIMYYYDNDAFLY